MINLELKLTVNESQIGFFSRYQDYGFESQEAMINSALEKFQLELEQNLEEQKLEESAQLYAEIYEQDTELQELTEAACSDVELGKLREEEKQKIQQLEQAQRDAIPRLYELGLTVEQIANALSLSVEQVNITLNLKV